MSINAKEIQDYGVTIILIAILLFFLFKYGTKWLDYLFDRAKRKDVQMELLMKTIENNTKSFEYVGKVIENNSEVIKSNTDNRHKLENNIQQINETFVSSISNLQKDIKQLDEKSNIIITDVKIVRSSKK